MKRHYDVLVFKLVRHRLTARQTFFIILAVFVGPFWIFNLENYLEEKGLHRFLIEWEEPVSTVVIGVIDFLASDIALGFVIGGVIASFWGTIRGGAARILWKGRANEARKVEWENADQDIKGLLSDMAAMSHELYLCRFDIELDREINNDRLNGPTKTASPWCLRASATSAIERGTGRGVRGEAPGKIEAGLGPAFFWSYVANTPNLRSRNIKAAK